MVTQHWHLVVSLKIRRGISFLWVLFSWDRLTTHRDRGVSYACGCPHWRRNSRTTFSWKKPSSEATSSSSDKNSSWSSENSSSSSDEAFSSASEKSSSAEETFFSLSENSSSSSDETFFSLSEKSSSEETFSSSSAKPSYSSESPLNKV